MRVTDLNLDILGHLVNGRAPYYSWMNTNQVRLAHNKVRGGSAEHGIFDEWAGLIERRLSQQKSVSAGMTTEMAASEHWRTHFYTISTKVRYQPARSSNLMCVNTMQKWIVCFACQTGQEVFDRPTSVMKNRKIDCNVSEVSNKVQKYDYWSMQQCLSLKLCKYKHSMPMYTTCESSHGRL